MRVVALLKANRVEAQRDGFSPRERFRRRVERESDLVNRGRRDEVSLMEVQRRRFFDDARGIELDGVFEPRATGVEARHFGKEERFGQVRVVL